MNFVNVLIMYLFVILSFGDIGNIILNCVLVIIICFLFLFGVLIIIIIYVEWKDMRLILRRILVYIFIVDSIVVVSYIFGVYLF